MKHCLDGEFQYGLKEGKLVHVSEVANGRKCNCICPSCREHLIAHNNPSERKAIHFQHENLKACKGYHETVLHYMAKEIIQESGYLDVPDVEYQLPESALEYQLGVTAFSREVINMKRLKFDSVELEMTEGAFRPDIKATLNGKSFYIEIAVSHKVDDIKLAKIREAGRAVLEIDLSKEPRAITKAELAGMLNSIVKMKWIHNPKIMKRLKEREEAGSKIAKFIRTNQKLLKLTSKAITFECPLYGEHYRIDIQNKCPRCNCFGGKSKTSTYDPLGRPSYFIHCIGHLRSRYMQLLKTLGVIQSD